MTTFVWWLLQDTLTVAALVAIVLVICRTLRAQPAVQHALWLVVLIKFITPPLVVWPWSVEAFAEPAAGWWRGADEHTARAGGADVSPSGADLPGSLVDRGAPGLPLAYHSDRDRTALPWAIPKPDGGASPPAADPGERSATQHWDADDARIARGLSDVLAAQEAGSARSTNRQPLTPVESLAGRAAPEVARGGPAWQRQVVGRSVPWVFAVWLVGGLAIGLAQWRRVARHARLVRGANAAPRHLTDEVRLLADAIAVRPLPALVARGLASPAVWCVGRLRLLWPESIADAASVARYRGVIAHELAHVARRDHWVAWIELLAGVVWWWNPCFWFVRRRLREAAELACDARAMSVLPDSRRAYAEAFLELSCPEKTGAPAPVLGMSTGARRKTFHRRFAMMLSERVRCKMSPAGYCLIGLLATVALPSWSLGQAQAPPRSAPAPEGGADSKSPQVPAQVPTNGKAEVDSGKTQLAPTDRAKPNPARGQDVEGRIIKVDPNAGLVTVSLGSDDGIQRNESLEVFRLGGQQPKYVGRIAVLEVGERETVALLAGPSQDAPQPGDQVARRLPTAAAQNVRVKDSLESRVQKLEEKLDAILDELRALRGAARSPTTPTGGKAAPPPTQVERATSPDGKVVAGPADQFAVIEALTRKLDDMPAHAQPRSIEPLSSAEPLSAPAKPAAPSKNDPNVVGPSVSPAATARWSGAELDVVSLATSIIEARGALRLAQARRERVQKLRGEAAVSQAELTEEEIHFDTAQQKLELLMSIARSAVHAARAEVAAAEEAVKHSQRLYQKGSESASHVLQAEAQVAATAAKLKLLEEIMSASTPATPPPAGQPAAEPKPPAQPRPPTAR